MNKFSLSALVAAGLLVSGFSVGSASAADLGGNCCADLEERIAAWETRLALRKEGLTRQFTAMETALSALQNQSTWLSGQLANLPKWS